MQFKIIAPFQTTTSKKVNDMQNRSTSESFTEDLGDFLGWGSARRQREFEAEQAEINRRFQEQSAEKAMQFEADQAELAWNRQMDASNSAHQREMADLQAAGLNPILAANGGATTPTAGVASGFTSAGAMAHGTQSNGHALERIIEAVGNAIGNANSGKKIIPGFGR